jgi:hypothetical protein
MGRVNWFGSSGLTAVSSAIFLRAFVSSCATSVGSRRCTRLRMGGVLLCTTKKKEMSHAKPRRHEAEKKGEERVMGRVNWFGSSGLTAVSSPIFLRAFVSSCALSSPRFVGV